MTHHLTHALLALTLTSVPISPPTPHTPLTSLPAPTTNPVHSPPAPAARSDQDVFHDLLRNHDKIRREVREIPGGVETLTESDDPAVALWIQQHVSAMKSRVEDRRPLRRWDPLFRAVFDHAQSIHMDVQPTPNGVRVRETSDLPHVTTLIQAHAKVVSAFVARGFDEAHEPHPVPPDPPLPTPHHTR